MKILVLIIVISVLSFAQENDSDLNFIYHFPHSQDSLLIKGYKFNESPLHIYASEFYVINCNTEDTLIFFGALQNCTIIKNGYSLSVIESKYVPEPFDNKWINKNYLKYNFNLSSDNKITIDTTFIFYPYIFTIQDELKHLKEYDEIKNSSKNISEELIYYILYMALNDESPAIKILFNMKDELQLDGSISEVNSVAINIYKTYLKLK